MSTMDTYFTTVTPKQRAVFEHIRQVVKETIPSVEEGTSYAMPAYLYKGKPLLSAMAAKKFLSLYPFSGKVVTALESKLKNYECTSGSIHFSEENPISDTLLKEIIQTRLKEIEERLAK